MSIFNALHFQKRFVNLGRDFYTPVQAQAIQQAQLVSVNPTAAALINLTTHDLNSDEFLALMACEQLPKTATPLASIYSGHQFGSYNPKLGDGRALLFAEIEYNNSTWELQLKGSGLTPYSRMGDGRAVLRSSIREYLCSEAMHALGIPSTRAIAISTSKTPVYREHVETASTLLRMAPTHIRFGHFEYFFYTQQHHLLKTLADFVIEHHYPEYHQLNTTEKYAQWFNDICKRTAHLIAQWQSVGFCHGVMNTDNMSIIGLTIDYGPFAFLDDFNLSFICNHSDHQGRYAYHRQVNIGLWNLNALAHALSPLISQADLRQSLEQYELYFLTHFRKLMLNKLGLTTYHDNCDDMISNILSLLAKERHDYTQFFRQLSETEDTAKLRDNFMDRAAFDAWHTTYNTLLMAENINKKSTSLLMLKSNPKFILRNYLAQQAIEKAELGNFSMVNHLLTVLQSPFDTHSEYQQWAELPPEWGKHLEISCSS